MVRPANFGWNPQTQASTRFQRADADLAAVSARRAVAEFEDLAAQLTEAGVRVLAAADREQPACPDAVFPNNWMSTHADGTVVLYPMLAPSRRLERRPEVLTWLVERGGFRVERLLDLTHHEREQRFLEGTGSVVFDHVARIAYATLSPRTHEVPLAELCEEIGYRACLFEAHDTAGVPVYHTNVMLAIGTRFVVVVAQSIARRDRERVIASLADSGRDIADIDARAMAGFAANVLELRAADGARVLCMSTAAAAACGAGTLARLRDCVDRVVAVQIPTIETLGGGSVRCMLAEVFLPGPGRALADRC